MNKRAIIAFTLLGLISGCATSISRQLQMRGEISSMEEVEDNIDDLLDDVDSDPSDPVRYSYALESLVLICNKSKLHKNAPDLYDDICSQLKENARSKRFGDEDEWIADGHRSDIGDYLRAYSLYSLTQIDSYPFNDLIALVGNRKYSIVTQLPVLNAIVSRESEFIDNPQKRLSVLLRLLMLEKQLKLTSHLPYNYSKLQKTVASLKNKYIDLQTLTALPSTSGVSAELLQNVLQLNYEHLLYLAQSNIQPEADELKANIDMLKMINGTTATNNLSKAILLEALPSAYLNKLISASLTTPSMLSQAYPLFNRLVKNKPITIPSQTGKLLYTEDDKLRINPSLLYGSEYLGKAGRYMEQATQTLLKALIYKQPVDRRENYYQLIYQNYPKLLVAQSMRNLISSRQSAKHIAQDIRFCSYDSQSQAIIDTIYNARSNTGISHIYRTISAYTMNKHYKKIIVQIERCLKTSGTVHDLNALGELYIEALTQWEKNDSQALTDYLPQASNHFINAFASKDPHLIALLNAYLGKQNPPLLIDIINSSRFTKLSSVTESDIKLLGDQLLVHDHYLKTHNQTELRNRMLAILAKLVSSDNDNISLSAIHYYTALTTTDTKFTATVKQRWPEINLNTQEVR